LIRTPLAIVGGSGYYHHGRFLKKETVMLPRCTGLLALLFIGFACCFAGESTSKSKSAAPADKGMVVHEWGTFSTFSGSNGKNLKFYPYDNDLPEFVHGYQERNSKAGPKGGRISLETPVLYFYSDTALTASVHVDFPKGTLTEWYPYAEHADKKLDWKGIKVVPGDKGRLLSEKKVSRYYAARETDAAPLRTTFFQDNKDNSEIEKFLFYRGVGDFDMPLSVKAQGDNKFVVTWDGTAMKEEDLILVRVQSGKIRFQPFHLKKSKDKGSYQAEVKLPDSDSTEDKLAETLVKQLTKQGLYEKEAQAMVKTWKSAWFGEEGTRVLYILSNELTEELLPLKVEPKPASLVRVLVGRHDVLTPEREKQIDNLVAEVNRPNEQTDANQKAAWQELVKLGRYRDAARTEAEKRLEKLRR
jgi:hypothetical protein